MLNLVQVHHVSCCLGIETTAIYWPALIKDSRKVIYFRLNFWDVGDNAIKKFDHILPVGGCSN